MMKCQLLSTEVTGIWVLCSLFLSMISVSFQDARTGKWWRPMSFFLFFLKAFLKSYCLGMEWHVEENTQEDKLLHKQGNVQTSESMLTRLNPGRSCHVTRTAIKDNLFFLFQTTLWLVTSKNTQGWKQERLMISRSVLKYFNHSTQLSFKLVLFYCYNCLWSLQAYCSKCVKGNTLWITYLASLLFYTSCLSSLIYPGNRSTFSISSTWSGSTLAQWKEMTNWTANSARDPGTFTITAAMRSWGTQDFTGFSFLMFEW